MKKTSKKILIAVGALVLFYLLSHLYNHFFTSGMITGTYVNCNYESSPVAPNQPDTIQLFENGQLVSSSYGKGAYDVSYSMKGTSIHLTFKPRKLDVPPLPVKEVPENLTYGQPIEPVYTYITRIWYGKPKIILFEDLGHYYKKID